MQAANQSFLILPAISSLILLYLNPPQNPRSQVLLLHFHFIDGVAEAQEICNFPKVMALTSREAAIGIRYSNSASASPSWDTHTRQKKKKKPHIF